MRNPAFSHPRIYIAYHVSTPYVVERMTFPTACVPEMQHATAREEWKSSAANAASCNVRRDPTEYVVVGFTSTGTFSVRGVPEFAPDWSDITPASHLL